MSFVETSVPPESHRLANSPIHGRGAFATRDIPKGSRIVEYIGERIDKRESLRRCEQRNEYIFYLNANEDLDGDVPWNPARFLNHSCSPNCEAELVDGHIWINAARDIRAGEELTFNYGFDLEDYEDYPCNCGSPVCVGFIVAEVHSPHVLSRKAHLLGKAGGRPGIVPSQLD
jgi:uncharacterized protein